MYSAFSGPFERHIFGVGWVRDNKMPDDALDRFIDLRVDIIIEELKNILKNISFEIIDTQEG